MGEHTYIHDWTEDNITRRYLDQRDKPHICRNCEEEIDDDPGEDLCTNCKGEKYGF